MLQKVLKMTMFKTIVPRGSCIIAVEGAQSGTTLLETLLHKVFPKKTYTFD